MIQFHFVQMKSREGREGVCLRPLVREGRAGFSDPEVLYSCPYLTCRVIERGKPPITQATVHVEAWKVHVLLTPKTSPYMAHSCECP